MCQNDCAGHMYGNIFMLAAGKVASLRSRHLKIGVNEDGIVISYEPLVALTLGSTLRERGISNSRKIGAQTGPAGRTT